MQSLPEDAPVIATVHVPNSNDVVVLLDPERRPAEVAPWHPYPNVHRIGPDRSIRWTAEPHSSEHAAKCWTGLRFDGSLVACTYSFECTLDQETGCIVSSTFTK